RFGGQFLHVARRDVGVALAHRKLLALFAQLRRRAALLERAGLLLPSLLSVRAEVGARAGRRRFLPARPGSAPLALALADAGIGPQPLAHLAERIAQARLPAL